LAIGLRSSKTESDEVNAPEEISAPNAKVDEVKPIALNLSSKTGNLDLLML